MFAVVLSVIISSTDAFCGGCGCNIFNCDCDFTPEQCGKCPQCRVTGRKRRSLDVGEYMDFETVDLDGNAFMDKAEFSLAFDR